MRARETKRERGKKNSRRKKKNIVRVKVLRKKVRTKPRSEN